MKNVMLKVREMSRNGYARAGVGVAALVGAGTASATVEPTGGAAAIAALETEAQSMIDAAWPVAILIVGATIGIKLFKKFANRAS